MAMALEQQQTYKTKACGGQRTGVSNAKGIGEYFTPQQMDALKEIMQTRKVAKGTNLFWEGDEADKLYFIIAGQVKLLKSNEDGKDLIISILQKGDLIAQFNGLGHSVFGFSAETLSSAEVGVIFRKELEELLVDHGDMALKFMYWLGLNNQIIESKLRDMLLYGKTGALASTLIRASNSYGVPGLDGSIYIQIKLTNTELGEMIGCTRESVNRMLSDWKNEGIVEMEAGRIIIRDLAALREHCKCPEAPLCPAQVCRL